MALLLAGAAIGAATGTGAIWAKRAFGASTSPHAKSRRFIVKFPPKHEPRTRLKRLMANVFSARYIY
jgi:hypothetical protein